MRTVTFRRRSTGSVVTVNVAPVTSVKGEPVCFIPSKNGNGIEWTPEHTEGIAFRFTRGPKHPKEV